MSKARKPKFHKMYILEDGEWVYCGPVPFSPIHWEGDIKSNIELHLGGLVDILCDRYEYTGKYRIGLRGKVREFTVLIESVDVSLNVTEI